MMHRLVSAFVLLFVACWPKALALAADPPGTTCRGVYTYRGALTACDEPWPINASVITATDGSGIQNISASNINGTLPPAVLGPELTALAAGSGTGLMVRTGVGGYAYRSLLAPAAGLTVTNGTGVAGNLSLVLANDLAALEGLSGTGYGVRTGTDTWAQRSITAVNPSDIIITNGDGVAGNTTLALNAEITALGLGGGTGLLTRTGAGAYAYRTLTGPAAGLTVTNGNGVAGNPTLALADDLAAIEALAGTGLACRTGASTWTPRAITPGSGIQVTNGDGVAGNPVVTLGAHASTHLQGGTDPVIAPTLIVTGATALTAANRYVYVNATGPYTLTLPSAPADGTLIEFLYGASTMTGAVTVARGGTDTIMDGTATQFFLGGFGSNARLKYIAAQTRWVILNLKRYVVTAYLSSGITANNYLQQPAVLLLGPVSYNGGGLGTAACFTLASGTYVTGNLYAQTTAAVGANNTIKIRLATTDKSAASDFTNVWQVTIPSGQLGGFAAASNFVSLNPTTAGQQCFVVQPTTNTTAAITLQYEYWTL